MASFCADVPLRTCSLSVQWFTMRAASTTKACGMQTSCKQRFVLHCNCKLTSWKLSPFPEMSVYRLMWKNCDQRCLQRIAWSYWEMTLEGHQLCTEQLIVCNVLPRHRKCRRQACLTMLIAILNQKCDIMKDLKEPNSGGSGVFIWGGGTGVTTLSSGGAHN